MRVWDIATGRLTVSIDRRWMVGRSQEGLTIWESASLRKVSKLEIQDGSNGVPVFFSTDNRLLLVCSTSECSALLLDAFNGMQVSEVSAGDGYLVSAETSPDGRWLALGHSDTSVLIYRWETLVPKRDGNTEAAKAELDAAYEDLAAEPEKAFAAIGRFLRAGPQGPQSVRTDANAIEALVEDLNNDDFTLREKATVSYHFLVLGCWWSLNCARPGRRPNNSRYKSDPTPSCRIWHYRSFEGTTAQSADHRSTGKHRIQRSPSGP